MFLDIFQNIYISVITGVGLMKKELMKEDVFNIFFREKPAMMLVTLNAAKSDIYASSLAKQIDCTYSHVVKILQEMSDAGLVNFDKQGRLKLLTLTKKGQEVADHIDKIRALL
jgi:DNA-binding MarR family transcriptional regulator